MGDYTFAYLLTVSDDYRVHTVTVDPVLGDGVVDVGVIGGRSCSNLAYRSDATLLWPPQELGAYSLIVDGKAEVTDSGDETGWLRIVPTRALLHREAASDSPSAAKGCLHDCVVFAQR